MELTVKHAVLLSSGLRIVAVCVSATQTVAVTPPLASAPATPTAGVHSAVTPASVPVTVTATLFTETAPATKAGGRRPAPGSATASPETLWAPAVTS